MELLASLRTTSRAALKTLRHQSLSPPRAWLLVGSHLNQTGVFWAEPGANAIIALRCCLLNAEL